MAAVRTGFAARGDEERRAQAGDAALPALCALPSALLYHRGHAHPHAARSGALRCAGVVEQIAARRDFAIAAGAGRLRGHALAAALQCDWLALDADASMVLDAPAAWGGVAWRIGRRALRLHLMAGNRLTAAEAFREGLADAVVPSGEDPVEWIAGWIGGRSTAALDSAAALISRRGVTHWNAQNSRGFSRPASRNNWTDRISYQEPTAMEEPG